jgi:hypothetical protein
MAAVYHAEQVARQGRIALDQLRAAEDLAIAAA